MDISPSKETHYLLGTPTKSYHNFKYGEALMHLVKAYIGTGIFSMGDAMKNAGLIYGTICLIGLGIICLHCCHLLVNTARDLYVRHDLEEIPDYAETAELCFALGANSFQSFSSIVRMVVNVFLVMAQIGFCCCYLVFISRNVQEVLKINNISLDIHWIILLVAFPIWLTCLIRTLKLLAPLSVVANIILVASLLIVLYYAFRRPIINSNSAKLWSPGFANFAVAFGEMVYAFEGIGLVLILYGEMKEPNSFKKGFGVLNVGLFLVTTIYTFFGTITYLQFGKDIKDTVTLNVQTIDLLAQTVLILISIGVSFTFSLQLYVAVDILWPKIASYFEIVDHPVIGEVLFRTVLVVVICGMSEGIPKLDILLSFVGSFMSIALIIIFPAILDLVNTYSCRNLDNFILVKDFLLIILGLIAMAVGTYGSIKLFAEHR